MTDDTTVRRTSNGRKAVWLAIAVAVGWLLVGGAVGPLSGKLSEVQSNDNASFLPASAESTIVAEQVKAFTANESFPGLVIATHPDGSALSPSDLQAVQEFAQTIPTLPVGSGTIADYLDTAQIPVFPSQDGQAALLAVPLSADKYDERIDGELALKAVADAIREAAVDVPGVQINVTGPAGILADLISVFGAIDTTLLGATALIVAIILILVYRSPFLWLIPLLAAGWALSVASAIVYVLAKNDVLRSEEHTSVLQSH